MGTNEDPAMGLPPVMLGSDATERVREAMAKTIDATLVLPIQVDQARDAMVAAYKHLIGILDRHQMKVFEAYEEANERLRELEQEARNKR